MSTNLQSSIVNKNGAPIRSPILGIGYNIGHRLFVGWVEHSDIDSWVSFHCPTYSSAIHMHSTKPNKLAEDKIIPF